MAGTSRITRESYVRFCGRLEVKFLRPTRRYTRIQGALDNLGHRVGRGTVANVLKRNGIEPAP